MSLSVAIADNHNVTCWGIRSVVDGQFGTVVATAQTGLQAVSLVQEQTPDLLVVSLRLPHLNGLDVLRFIQRSGHATTSIVLTICEDEKWVRTVFEWGAQAYVLKSDPLSELHRAIDASLHGEQYLSDGLPTEYMMPQQETTGSDPYQGLSMREREVVQMTAEGYTSREVGNHLGISPRTVEKHRQHVQEKLELSGVVEMAYYVYQQGILPEPRVLHAYENGAEVA